MIVLPILIGISTLLLIVAGVALLWAANNDQFEDLDTPRMLPLTDERSPPGSPRS